MFKSSIVSAFILLFYISLTSYAECSQAMYQLQPETRSVWQDSYLLKNPGLITQAKNHHLRQHNWLEYQKMLREHDLEKQNQILKLKQKEQINKQAFKLQQEVEQEKERRLLQQKNLELQQSKRIESLQIEVLQKRKQQIQLQQQQLSKPWHH